MHNIYFSKVNATCLYLIYLLYCLIALILDSFLPQETVKALKPCFSSVSALSENIGMQATSV